MALTQLDASYKDFSTYALSFFNTLLFVVFRIQFNEANIVRSDVKQHELLNKDVLGELVWHCKHFLQES